jgi:homoserine O-acetyltransferase
MNESVGIVEPKKLILDGKLDLECGQSLEDIEIVYETYGNLNQDSSNAILICHALSGNHHAAGMYEGEKRTGWWDSLIGPGKAIDTDKFYVVCPNNIGGCHGSIGPSSKNSKTGEYFGPDFPIITVKDWVRSQALLSNSLGIKKWHAVVGGSLGGMQALEWSRLFPDRIKKAGIIAGSTKIKRSKYCF